MAAYVEVNVKRGPGIGKHLDGRNASQPLPTSTARAKTLITAQIVGVQAVSTVAEFDSSLTSAGGSLIYYNNPAKVTVEEYWVTQNMATIQAAL